MTALIAAGAQPDTESTAKLGQRESPLHTAVKARRPDLLRLLLESHRRQLSSGKSPTKLRGSKGKKRAKQKQVCGGEAGWADMQMTMKGVPSHTAVNLAALNGEVECVRMLIEEGVDLNLVDREGDSPLYNALKNGSTNHLICADLLLRAGANPFLRRTPRDTPDWAWTAWEVIHPNRSTFVTPLLTLSLTQRKVCLSETMSEAHEDNVEGLAIATLCLNMCRRVYRRPFGKKRQRVVEYNDLALLLGLAIPAGTTEEAKSKLDGAGAGDDERTHFDDGASAAHASRGDHHLDLSAVNQCPLVRLLERYEMTQSSAMGGLLMHCASQRALSVVWQAGGRRALLLTVLRDVLVAIMVHAMALTRLGTTFARTALVSSS